VACSLLQETIEFSNGWECFLGLTQVKLDLSCLRTIKDDMDFCCRLAKEELMVILPGTVLPHTDILDVKLYCQTIDHLFLFEN
jgi:hypothetical protein